MSTAQALDLTRITRALLENAGEDGAEKPENVQEGLLYYNKVIHDLEVLEVLRHNITIEQSPSTGDCYLYSADCGSIPKEVYKQLKEWMDGENAQSSQ